MVRVKFSSRQEFFALFKKMCLLESSIFILFTPYLSKGLKRLALLFKSTGFLKNLASEDTRLLERVAEVLAMQFALDLTKRCDRR
jgi:hypothetical protein